MTRFVRLAIVFELSLAALAFGIGWVVGVNPWGRLELDRDGLLIGLAATAPLVLLLWLFDREEIAPMRRIRALLEEFLLPPLRDRSFWELALLAVAAGLGEETLFRGLAQDGLKDVIGFGPALVLVSILFGLVHALTPTYAAITFLISLFLGLVHEWSGNLLAPIVAHGLYDLIALIYFLRTSGEARIGEETIHPDEETS